MVQVPTDWQPQRRTGPSSLARDMAKVGQLVFATGHVERQASRVAAYIDSATTPRMNGYELNCYGYHFWLGRSLVAKREVQWTSAVVPGA